MTTPVQALQNSIAAAQKMREAAQTTGEQVRAEREQQLAKQQAAENLTSPPAA